MKNEIHAVIASLGMALIVNYVIWFGSSLNYHPDTPVLWLSFSIIYPFIYYIIFFSVTLFTKLPPNLDNQHWSNFTNRSINFIIKIGYISLIIIGILVISFGIFFIIIPLGTKY